MHVTRQIGLAGQKRLVRHAGQTGRLQGGKKKGRRNNMKNNDNDKVYGHKKMVVWQNIDKIDEFVHKSILPKIPQSKHWLIRQIESANDSVGANFVEGYYSGSIPEYLRFLSYSKRSLAELRDHITRSVRKNYVGYENWQIAEKFFCQTLYLFGRLIPSLKNKLL